ncbi:hypothetical protein [Streptomyces sp. NPDC056160]|uniref:hypothetical protein n=1 Tax=Streptomyces sp. NPDC056160 TaxID=3345731 RepID=UPI0035DFAAB4
MSPHDTRSPASPPARRPRQRLAALPVPALAVLAALATPAHSDPGFTVAVDQDFPDPSVATDGTTYFAYATTADGKTYATATAPSPDGPSALTGTDAMPNPPPWARAQGDSWAPDVSPLGDGTWLMHFTAHDPSAGHEGVGVATSPLGPYQPVGDQPLARPPAAG